ncbi:MAG: OmpA family protein [Phormidesmis sp.]
MSSEPESTPEEATDEQGAAWSNFYASRPVLRRGVEDSGRVIAPFDPANPEASAYSSPLPNPMQAETEAGASDRELPPAQPQGRFRRLYSPWLERTAYVAALGGSLMAAWLLGILIAQILPGSFDKPPLQEAVLRKSSRVASRLWHFRQLWQFPTEEIRVEAIPLPESGPVLAPVELSPMERQPLIDELNSIETEIITLDRRLQTLEKQLGKPPYQGADIDSRVNSLRIAIDPPVRPEVAADYEPVPSDPTESLLTVAKLKITLPSDALFAPGQSDIKDTALLHQVLDQLVDYPGATVLIRSYSDDQARAIDSRKYTFAQATALSDYLQAALPESYRWVILGGGQSSPVASNEDAAGRQRNRRVEILVDSR